MRCEPGEVVTLYGVSLQHENVIIVAI